MDLPKNSHLGLHWREFVVRKGSLCTAGASWASCTSAQGSLLLLLQAAGRITAVLLLLALHPMGLGMGHTPQPLIS